MPFYETAEEATNTAILKSDKTHQQVAAHLRPETSLGTAYAWLKNALNPEAREKLSSDQHAAIAVFCDQADWLHYNEMKLHHSISEKLDPEDEAYRLEREIAEGLQLQNKLMGRYLEIKQGAGR